MDDTISRQAALDALDEQIEQCNKALGSFDISLKDEFAIKVERASLKAYKEQLENLPTVQPTQEIIHCKDCCWLAKQEEILQGRCALLGIYPTGEWYCAHARKRGEEDGRTDKQTGCDLHSKRLLPSCEHSEGTGQVAVSTTETRLLGLH